MIFKFVFVGVMVALAALAYIFRAKLDAFFAPKVAEVKADVAKVEAAVVEDVKKVDGESK